MTSLNKIKIKFAKPSK